MQDLAEIMSVTSGSETSNSPRPAAMKPQSPRAGARTGVLWLDVVLQGRLIVGIDEDICIEETTSAHEFCHGRSANLANLPVLKGA